VACLGLGAGFYTQRDAYAVMSTTLQVAKPFLRLWRPGFPDTHTPAGNGEDTGNGTFGRGTASWCGGITEPAVRGSQHVTLRR
jgi:hypothetical protein